VLNPNDALAFETRQRQMVGLRILHPPFGHLRGFEVSVGDVARERPVRGVEVRNPAIDVVM
jgi:hypothetical protein